ncbi:wall-associated receptor kinase 1-like [Lolium rigidum]|uniref:wall-associated receptor kinase 1-like n=2 Tax=Lolium TaxID=4520 RepID=UPI001F5C7D1A|nr:wall-associated receptor kinase 1-like [Lolium rigidum]
MPSQYSQLLPLLLVAATIHTILAADAERPPAGCPKDEKCGNISIPYPFGIKAGCSLAGFEVICNHSFQPPRAFLSRASARHEIGHATYTSSSWYSLSMDSSPPIFSPYVPTYSAAPVELLDISASKSELRVYGGVTSDCLDPGAGEDAETKPDHHHVNIHSTKLGPAGGGEEPFLLSLLRNVLLGVGSKAEAQFIVSPDEVGRTGAGSSPLIACISSNIIAVRNGSCTGMGCCQASVSRELLEDRLAPDFFAVTLGQNMARLADDTNTWSPCSYGMLVESSWYNFSSEDLYGHELSNKHPRGVPVVLDFAIRSGNRSCPAEGQKPPKGYACISGNSSCATPPSGDGYICRCHEHYDGNPYINNGCQDIDECNKDHPLHNCDLSRSTCHNTPGGYKCPCKRGMRGDGKKGTCTEIFSLPAKVVVGVIAFFLVILALVLAHQLLKLKKFYKQNGGPILKGVKNIRIYTSSELKQMTNNYKVVIGEGHFGTVYMGTLKDKQEVAIKKTIKVDESSKKEFIDEVIIQSGMRHKNIARLLGCCLQMDVPMLMYEYVVKGSLYDVLFKSKDIIPVDTRLRIAIGSAEGLAYMHSAVENTIRHGDVKSANILLDESFTPKISDFGTSKLLARGKSEKTEWVTGDKAYIDPEYMAHGTLTQKSDVYSFGIVLIELITRRVAKYDDNMSYVKNFVQACQDQRARNFLDNDVTSEKDIELLEMVSEVAMECLKLNPEERLDMRQVENRLYIIGQSEQHGQEMNFQGNLSPNMEVPLLKSVESRSPTN